MADIQVWLRCPACGHEWHAATITEGAWWAEGLKPETAAHQCWCRRCHHKPPMLVVHQAPTSGQLELF